MASLLRRLNSGKNAGEAAAKKNATKRVFSFLSRSRKSTYGVQEKKKRKALRWKASLTKLLAASSWEQIRDLLNDSDLEDVEKWIINSTDFLGQTALHHALRSHAPLDIVHRIMDFGPSGTIEQVCDCSGRTALHVAAGWGGAADLVASLLRGGTSKISNLVRAEDFDGRTALHLACLSTASGIAHSIPKHARKGTAGQQREVFLENRREVVRVLLDACFKVAAATDKGGKTPLDYAMENGDDQVLICFLRGAAKKCGLEKMNRRRRRGPWDKKSSALLTKQSYSCSANKISSSNFRIRSDPSQWPDPLRDFLIVNAPIAGTGDKPDDEKKVHKSALVNATVPPVVQCPLNWKDDVSAITQPRGLGPMKVF